MKYKSVKNFLNRILKKIYSRIDTVKIKIASLSAEERKKYKKRLIIIGSSVIALLIVLAVAAGITANHLLNKINYGDVEGVVDENLDEEEEIDFDIAEYKEITDKNKSDAEKNSEADDGNKSGKKSSLIRNILKKEDDYNNLNAGKEVQQQANREIKENIESEGAWYSDSVINILIVGYDAGDAEAVMFEGATLPRSDAVLIASINKVKKTVKLVSMSRATYVAIPNHGNKRLNTAHAYGGAKTLVETIELNYKIRIDRYITADFKGFKAIVDALGGVEVKMTKVEADFAFNTDTMSDGTYKLNGTQALRYVRLRKTDSDRLRTLRQRRVLTSIAGKAKKMNVAQKIMFMNNVLPYVTTNFMKSELLNKVSEYEIYLDWPLTQDIVPHNATQLTMKDGKEVLILDWEETTDYIHNILYSGVTVKKEAAPVSE